MVHPPRPRRVVLALLLLALVAALALVVARTLPLSAPRAAATATVGGPTTPSPTARVYSLYLFAPQLPVVPAPVRPGQTLTVTWQPQLDPNQQVYVPTPVECSVELFGRFASRAAAQQANMTLNFPHASPPPLPGTPIVWPVGLSPAVEGPPLMLDGVTPVTRTSALVLPADLSPGYYLLDARSRGVDGSEASDVVLLVAPPTA